MVGICKSFGNVKANRNVDFRLKKGEIHSLLGENGAGKTTLMNILYGLYSQNAGEIRVNEKPVSIQTPLEAIRLGIAMVHQHFMLIDSLTVAENVVIGVEPKKGMRFDFQQACKDVERISEEYGLKVNPRDKIGSLPVGTRQRVEILKALYRNADVFILDEPTAVLTPGEVIDLFSVLEGLRAAGKSIIIITHKLQETLDIADTITVLRQGSVIASLPCKDVNADDLAEMMVGRRIAFSVKKQPVEGQRPVLMELKNGVLKNNGIRVLDGIDLTLYGGEILGIAGVSGNGQTELVQVLTGLQTLTQGELYLNGTLIKQPTAAYMLAHGVGHIQEDRHSQGMIREFSVSENLILGYQKNPAFSGKVLLKRDEVRRFSQQAVEEFDVRCDGIDSPMGLLSGGNQQKVVISCVIKEDPQVVIAAQPTRGVDIGAIEFIHDKLLELRRQGKAILLVSTELDEIIQLSDRIGVLYSGRLVDTGPASAFDEVRLGRLMIGKTDGAEA